LPAFLMGILTLVWNSGRHQTALWPRPQGPFVRSETARSIDGPALTERDPALAETALLQRFQTFDLRERPLLYREART
jgi:hypothetical protein